MSLERMHVLIVEDNADHAESLARLLASRAEVAYTSEVVGTLKDAIFKLEFGGIDAVLLDLSLPDARGIEVIERVHAAKESLPIVVLTGWGGSELEQPAKDAGAGAVLSKPAEPVDISINLQSVVIHARHDKQKSEMGEALAELERRMKKMAELREGVGA